MIELHFNRNKVKNKPTIWVNSNPNFSQFLRILGAIYNEWEKWGRCDHGLPHFSDIITFKEYSSTNNK